MANESSIPLERVMSRADVRGPDECWPLRLATTRNGYVLVSNGARTRAYAHRVVLTHTQGVAPERADGRHLCGSKTCVNPAHLAWGSRAQNEADKIAMGRSNRGERQGQSKLTSEQVLAIRERCGLGESQSSIARAFGLHQATVSQIVNRKRWAWL